MHSYQQLKDIVNTTLSQQTFDKTPKTLFQPIKYILSIGGKRIRPILTLMSCEMFEGSLKSAIFPALGLEIFHNFTLLHDDVMDNANLRRGKPTVHEKWNNNIAILSGDAMSITSYQYITKCKEKHLSDVLKVFNQTAVEVCQGQQMDMEFEKSVSTNIDEYLTMIKYKTAVLFGCSMKIGSILTDISDAEQQLMYDLGLNIGLTFQLQDDYLDSFGDKNIFGKNIGGDILANKKTFLLIKALENAKGKSKKILHYYIKEKKIKNSEKKINAILDIYKSMKIDDLIKKEIAKYINQSYLILDEIMVPENKKIEIKKLIKKMTARNQ